LKNPVKITIGSEDLSANIRIQQIVEVCDRAAKESKLEALLQKYHKKGNKIIIFCLYKMEAARVEQTLQRRVRVFFRLTD
jgi:ATP-dependent RNA helicase DBP3